jgi:hypothetical protein
MKVAGLRQGRTEASIDAVKTPLEERQSLRQSPKPMPRPSPGSDGEIPWRRRAAGLRRRWQRAAEHIRNSTGIVRNENSRQGAVAHRMWPRLLLWVFACIALVVSLVLRADGVVDRDPRSAVRNTATGQPGASFLKDKPNG